MNASASIGIVGWAKAAGRSFGATATILLLTPTPTSLAAPVAARPRIGVALSGGSARGLAHLGFLQWMEEHRIPVDCLAGTSAGGLFGGLYAAGNSPENLRAVAKSIDWKALLSIGPEYRSVPLRRKEDRHDYPFRLELHDGTLPRALNNAAGIEKALEPLCRDFDALRSFDDLPTPFRCVATEMVHGEMVVLHDGPLLRALRATSAIPGYFAPVVIDNETVLADGVLVNNLPTDVVREMGADVVIGVDVTFAITDHHAWKTVGGMMDQAACIMADQQMQRQRKLADVLVDVDALVPEFVQFGANDYPKSEAIVEAGYKAAAKMADTLERYALDEEAWEVYQTERKTRLEACLADAGTNGAAPATKSADAVESVTRFHVGLGGNAADDMQFSLGGRMTAAVSRSVGDEYQLNAGVGHISLVEGEYYRPVGGDGWFTSVGGGYRSMLRGFVDSGGIAGSYRRQETGAELSFGWTDRKSIDVRLIGRAGYLQQSLRSGLPSTDMVDGETLSLAARLTYEDVDHAFMPTRGTRASMEFRRHSALPGSGETIYQAEARWSSYLKLGGKDTGLLFGGAGTSFGTHPPLAAQLAVGGPFKLSAYSEDAFRGSGYFHAGAGIFRRLAADLGPLGNRASIGVWYELGNAYQVYSLGRVRHCLSGGLVIDSLFGPIVLGVGLGEHGRSQVMFLLGSRISP